MRLLNSTFFLLLLVCVLSGCGVFKNKKVVEVPKGPQTVLVGIVEMVNPEQNYVLIRCETPTTLKAGTELVAVDSTGAESRLRLTPERKGRYLTADILEGQPKVMGLVAHRTTGDAPVNTALAPLPVPPAPPGAAVAPIPLDPLAAPPMPLDPAGGSFSPAPLEPALPAADGGAGFPVPSPAPFPSSSSSPAPAPLSDLEPVVR